MKIDNSEPCFTNLICSIILDLTVGSTAKCKYRNSQQGKAKVNFKLSTMRQTLQNKR